MNTAKFLNICSKACRVLENMAQKKADEGLDSLRKEMRRVHKNIRLQEGRGLTGYSWDKAYYEYLEKHDVVD